MGKKRIEEMEDLDLVPIMNLVTILIPFLLMASSFVSLAVIDSTLPAIGAPSEPSEPEDDKKPLNLSVAITSCGYTILGSGGQVGNAAGQVSDGESTCTVPCKVDGCPTPDSYDAATLTERIAEIKDNYPDEQNVILVPSSTTNYEVLVMTMDATRADENNKVNGKARELFPFVVIAGGAQ